MKPLASSVSSLDHALQPALDQREHARRYRRRQCVTSAAAATAQMRGHDSEYVSFCSNDYLALANHPKVVAASQQAIQHYGVGSGASHLVCGHSEEHHLLEHELAAFTGRERALLFSTGYMANMGVISALVGRGDEVFEDRLNHASLIDGGLLSKSTFTRFHHNNLESLESRLLASSAKRKLIVVDGVFSMDGDVAMLPELSALAKKHQAWLMVDDAHGFGCLGKGGRGTVEHFNLSAEDVPILVGTLGKAFGTFGAFVVGSHTLIESLIQFARPYIYTTAMPPAIAAASRISLQLVRDDTQRRENLQGLIAYFRDGCRALNLPLMDSLSPIQPMLLSSDDRALRYSKILLDQGVWVTAIRPPTVPEGSARLRITLRADHTHAHIDQLLQALVHARKVCDDAGGERV